MVSIFTPTFNRRESLIQLAESLLQQTCKYFEWIIVDDGSSDGTREVIDQYKDKINIYYMFQRNSGKHVAYNQAITLCKGELFVCVDSDDLLTPDAIETYINIYKQNDGCIGYLLPQKLSGSNDSEKWYVINQSMINIADLKFLYGITESNIAIKSFYLKKYKFPVICGSNGKQEKFCPEDYLYNQLSNEGKFKVNDHAVYVSEYLPDGLTSNVFKLWFDNSESVLKTLKTRYQMLGEYTFTNKLVNRCKCIMNVNALCMATGKKIKDYTPNKYMSILLYLPSIIFRRKRFYGYE